MKNNKNNDVFFKKIASLYVDREAKILKDELKEIENTTDYPELLDKKIKTKIYKIKTKNIINKLIPLAACIVIASIYFGTNKFQNNNYSENITIKKQQDIEYLSAKLPNGYNITNVDYDKEKTIYYIINETNNKIVLICEKPETESNTELFKEIHLNNEKLYLLAKNDFNILVYKKDDTLYTFSSQYNYNDLIELSKNFI